MCGISWNILAYGICWYSISMLLIRYYHAIVIVSTCLPVLEDVPSWCSEHKIEECNTAETLLNIKYNALNIWWTWLKFNNHYQHAYDKSKEWTKGLLRERVRCWQSWWRLKTEDGERVLWLTSPYIASLYLPNLTISCSTARNLQEIFEIVFYTMSLVLAGGNDMAP